VSVLKKQTVRVNPLYCGNRLASLSSTFIANIKKCLSVPLKDKFVFVLFHTKTTINGDERSLKVATSYELSLYSPKSYATIVKITPHKTGSPTRKVLN